MNPSQAVCTLASLVAASASLEERARGGISGTAESAGPGGMAAGVSAAGGTAAPPALPLRCWGAVLLQLLRGSPEQVTFGVFPGQLT